MSSFKVGDIVYCLCGYCKKEPMKVSTVFFENGINVVLPDGKVTGYSAEDFQNLVLDYIYESPLFEAMNEA